MNWKQNRHGKEIKLAFSGVCNPGVWDMWKAWTWKESCPSTRADNTFETYQPSLCSNRCSSKWQAQSETQAYWFQLYTNVWLLLQNQHRPLPTRLITYLLLVTSWELISKLPIPCVKSHLVMCGIQEGLGKSDQNKSWPL